MSLLSRSIMDDIHVDIGYLRLFLGRRSFMRKQFDLRLDRRDLFRAALAAAAATATSAMIIQPAAASTGGIDKRKARYQAHSAEVENFYRVNRYPVR
jgi:hypothetical protein